MALPHTADNWSEFRRFCKQASDSQLGHILKKEWDAGREDDYRAARPNRGRKPRLGRAAR